MEPFYFGTNDALFGAFHMAEGMPRRHGVLLAGPLLNEGIRAQFALRQIAGRCAAMGYDVLRFDYRGLGNSNGSSAEMSLEDWSADMLEAAEELARVSGAETQTLITVRFAANLAAPLLETMALERLVMWDPILQGDHWLALLREAQSKLPSRLRDQIPDPDREFQGHATGAGFVPELEARPPLAVNGACASAVVTADYRYLQALRAVSDDVEQVDADCRWQANTSDVLYPIDVIRSLCSRLA